MSTIEELQVAIEKLTEMRGDSAEWWVFEPDPTAIYQTTEGGLEDHVLDTVEESDRDLIVTLHRTIDAQLAILHHAIAEYEPRDDTMSFITEDGLTLARAINGGTQ